MSGLVSRAFFRASCPSDCGLHLVADRLQTELENPNEVRLVVDDQHPRARLASIHTVPSYSSSKCGVMKIMRSTFCFVVAL